MSAKIKTAIIGCGDIAGGYDERKKGEGVFTHAGAYCESPEIEIVAAFDINPKRLDAFCKFWQVGKTCYSLEELLKEKYDIVSVCTGDALHYELLEKILDSGSASYIWAEKPFTHSAETAGKIISKARKLNVGLWLSNQRRWDPGHLALREKIHGGDIGSLLHANGYYVKGITHIGCTMIDTLRFLCGEVVWAEAFPPFDCGSYGGDYSLRGILGFADGATATIAGCDGNEYVYSLFELDIIGTHGRVRIEENGDIISLYQAVEYDHYPGFKELKLVEKSETQMLWAMKYGLELLLKDMSEGNSSVAFAEEGLRDLIVVDALKQSAEQGGLRIEL